MTYMNKFDAAHETKKFWLSRVAWVAVVSLLLLGGCRNESVETGREREQPSNLSPQESEMLDACVKGDTARVKQLLDKGVSANMRGTDRNTPIMEAAYGGHLDTVKLLLDRGADLSAKKSDGATPITLASDKSILALFKDVTALVSAAEAGNEKIVTELIDKGTPVNGLDQFGQSALHVACWNGKTEIVKLLLARGADPRIKKADGAMPLTLAKGQGHEDIVALLNEAIAKQPSPPNKTVSPAK